MRETRALRILTTLSFLVIASASCSLLKKKGDDAGVDAAPATSVTAATTDTAPATSTSSTPTIATVKKTLVASKDAGASDGGSAATCGKDESLVVLDDTGAKVCAQMCVDPSCDCKRGIRLLPNGNPSSAPGDHAAWCVASKSKTAAADAGAPKKALPKCAAGTQLVAEADDTAPYCAKSCSGDADCKPKKCSDMAFAVDPKTGVVFTGVGKSFPVCAK